MRELGEAITRDYADVAGDAGIVVVSILRGGAVFTCDLIRAIDLPLEVDFMAVSSYGNGAKSSGVVRILKDLNTDIRGRHVVIAEDIIDSGLTLKYLLKNLQSREPASLTVAALMRKDTSAQADHPVPLYRLRVPRRVHRRLRPRLCRALPQPPLHRRSEAEIYQ